MTGGGEHGVLASSMQGFIDRRPSYDRYAQAEDQPSPPTGAARGELLMSKDRIGQWSRRLAPSWGRIETTNDRRLWRNGLLWAPPALAGDACPCPHYARRRYVPGAGVAFAAARAEHH